jgi:hypothetical protein
VSLEEPRLSLARRSFSAEPITDKSGGTSPVSSLDLWDVTSLPNFYSAFGIGDALILRDVKFIFEKLQARD